ncbi:hypothetical protein RGQ29_015499 [Quercus rubra]|uniref:Uncharacterized protein n=1 Tax=Quercus rubra TaxID=3512 RepID=A0AAN7FQ71_QUERU|nr:hypothetical protein RGQ29_015499 [Quercus rubra]
MIPCPLGSYCPLATLNKTTGVCELYLYDCTNYLQGIQTILVEEQIFGLMLVVAVSYSVQLDHIVQVPPADRLAQVGWVLHLRKGHPNVKAIHSSKGVGEPPFFSGLGCLFCHQRCHYSYKSRSGL